MSDKVSNLESLLSNDRSNPSAPNLLPIHFQLQQLEAFRNETLHQAKKSNDQGELEVLKKWFEKLDKVGEEFEAWLWEIGGNVVELARGGEGGTVVRLVKIVEVEGKEDEKVSPGSCSLLYLLSLHFPIPRSFYPFKAVSIRCHKLTPECLD